MTVHKLMNTANVTPDVVISIYDRSLQRDLYSGPYEESPNTLWNLEVDSFRVTHLRQLEYRTDIDRMAIYI